MIDITIKTLDSMNHQFSVQDDLTVKKFKEQIASQVNVPAESQRLIYCGRVLVDDKKLADYDVHGKVIHLVQRAPPSTTSSDSGNGGGESRSTQSRNVGWRPFNQTVRLDGANGNAMYLGAMAFPAELMDAQGITVPQPRQGLSQNRFSVWRTMLRRARNLLHHLEHPTQAEPPPPQPTQNVNTTHTTSNLDHIAIVAQALTEAVTRATGNNLPPPVINIEFAARRMDSNESPPGEPAADTSSSNSPDELSSSASINDPLLNVPPEVERPTNSEQSPPAEGESTNTNSRNGNRSRSSNSSSTANAAALAVLIDQLRDINQRITPFLDMYYTLMRDDPPLEYPNDTQRVFNQISELMHYMAHTYHALSDVICDFSQPPPRTLRCRPVLIQHSAVLQAGVPIQLNLGAVSHSNSQNRGTTASNTDSERNTNQPSAGATPSAQGEERTSNASTSEEPTRTPEPSTHSTNRSTSQMNFVPAGEFEFVLDVAHSAEFVPDTGIGSLLGGRGENGDGRTSRGEAQNIIQSLVDNIMSQTVYEINTQLGGGNGSSQMGESGSTSNRIQGNSTAVAADGNEETNREEQETSPNRTESNIRSCVFNIHSNVTRPENEFPSNSSGTTGPFSSIPNQVWSSTETWPTTSTNTRSTTRPHVHVSPGLQARLFAGIGTASMHGFFDPFLPCNSHHIRSSRRRNQNQQAEQPSGQSASNNSANAENTEASGPSTGSTTERSTTASGADEIRARRPRDDFYGLLNQHTTTNLRPTVPRNLRMMSGDRFTGENNTIVFHIPNHVTPLPRLTPYLRIVQDAVDLRDHPNLIAELFTIISSNIRLFDFWACDARQILLSLRTGLVQFVRETLLSGQVSPEEVSDAVDRLNSDLRPAFRSFQEWLQSIHSRYDNNINVVESLNQLHRFYLPKIIFDILQEDENLYFQNISKHLTEYGQHLTGLIEHLCQFGDGPRDMLETAFIALGSLVLVSVPGMDTATRHHLARELRLFAFSMIPSNVSIQRFLVRTTTPPGAPSSTPTPAGLTTNGNVPLIEILIPSSSRQAPAPVPPPQQATPAPPAPIPPVATPQQPPPPVQPMEVEDPFVETEGVPTAEQIAEPLPDVIIGAEQWHNHVPPDWVPIITRDRERQRRQTAQGALSEAYLSGMPSKRRKVVTSTKPHSNLARVISESMTTAMGAAGVSPVESVAENAGTDMSIRAAYKEQVRTTVEAKLRTNPDYKPEKYPNAAKLFGPK
ncbi:large proline-rich protein bag6-A isoform X2 [Cimex lectularius]|uniref:Large proline-rich protein BAG6 n=1 Tax=Cimex lectularius TaxID=79782 RepID=A0A8I6SM67_CIMLE|nr:large proline-rich protein bag6-A isoform X2 [Cimex lectularius]